MHVHHVDEITKSSLHHTVPTHIKLFEKYVNSIILACREVLPEACNIIWCLLSCFTCFKLLCFVTLVLALGFWHLCICSHTAWRFECAKSIACVCHQKDILELLLHFYALLLIYTDIFCYWWYDCHRTDHNARIIWLQTWNHKRMICLNVMFMMTPQGPTQFNKIYLRSTYQWKIWQCSYHDLSFHRPLRSIGHMIAQHVTLSVRWVCASLVIISTPFSAKGWTDLKTGEADLKHILKIN